MQIQIQILIQLQYLPSWVPWRGNCLPPFPHNALPSIPRAEISLSTILQFHGVHFSIFVYFFHRKRLFVYLHLYLSHTVGRVSPWVRLRLRKFLNFQPRYTPLPLSTADIEIHSSGLGLFRLCPLNIKTNRQQIHHPEERAITTSGVFQGKPWHLQCTYKDDKKNARDALLLRTVHIYPWLAPVWPAIADVTQEAPTCFSLVFPTHSTACRSNPCPLLRIAKHVNPLF